MVDFYPLIVECAIELRYQLRHLIWKYDGRGILVSLFYLTYLEGQDDLPDNLW
jgi:hypothetical protein